MALKYTAVLVCILVLSLVSVSQAMSPYVNFTTLPKSLIVSAQINGQNITEGSTLLYMHDTLTVSWKLNSSFSGNDSNYKKVLIKLCFGASSAVDRAWRKNNANLLKSKTCKYKIAAQKYTPEGNTTKWKAPDDIPGAYYFVRAFVLNDSSTEAVPGMNAVAFGQTSDKDRKAHLFQVIPYKGRTWTLNIAVIVISIASYATLAAYFVYERSSKKNR